MHSPTLYWGWGGREQGEDFDTLNFLLLLPVLHFIFCFFFPVGEKPTFSRVTGQRRSHRTPESARDDHTTSLKQSPLPGPAAVGVKIDRRNTQLKLSRFLPEENHCFCNTRAHSHLYNEAVRKSLDSYWSIFIICNCNYNLVLKAVKCNLRWCWTNLFFFSLFSCHFSPFSWPCFFLVPQNGEGEKRRTCWLTVNLANWLSKRNNLG